MREFFAESATAGVVLSFMFYFLGTELRKHVRSSLCNPLLIAIILVIAFLLIFDIDYEIYEQSAGYLSYLLTPATVSLAVPMYEKLDKLKRYPVAICVGILSGVVTSLFAVLILSVLFSLSHEQYVTLLPKSITTAIGMGVSEELGGAAVITTAVIIITGILGSISAELIWRLFHIEDPVARGISLGTASHAIGTSKAMEVGETEGAMSSLSIVISGLCTVVLANVFAPLW